MSDFYSDKHFPTDKHKGHRARVRNKVINGGFENLLDYEKVELLLFWSITRRDTKDIAVDLINSFGSFNAVLDADEFRLREIPNLGESSIFLIKTIKQIAEYYMRKITIPILSFKDMSAVEDNILKRLSVEKVERLYVFFLDNQYSLIKEEIFTSPHINRINVDVSEIMRMAVKTSCSQIIIAHNHPYGLPTPSQEDLRFTAELDELSSGLRIRLLQHYIVGEGKCIPIMR